MGRVIYRCKALDNHISSILNIFAKSLWFKSSFEKIVFFFKTENMNRIFDSIFKRFVGIEQIRWRWKAGKNTHLPYIYFFSNYIQFKSNLKNGEILDETYFCFFFKWFVGLTQMIRRWKATENAQLFRIEIFF